MSVLPSELVQQFVKGTNDETIDTTAKFYNGVAVVNSQGIFVRLDGSTSLTPVSVATDAKNGDRVLVSIENHKASIVNNLTSPASGRSATDLYSVEITENGDVIVKGELRAAKEYVDELIAKDITVTSLVADIAKIGKLEADKASITDLTATNAEIENIKANYISAEKADIKYATITDLTATKADITNLTGEYISFKEGEFETLKSAQANFETTTTESLKATEAKITDLEATTLKADEADIKYATITDLTATNANITKLEANKANITDLEAANAKIENLEADTADINKAIIDKADIDFANVLTLDTVTAIVEGLLKAGHIIGDKVEAQTGEFTNYLTGVRIVGDVIDANTIKAETLIITGTDGLYYQLNASTLGIEAVEVDTEKYSKALDGSVIVEKSITAQKITVDDLVAFGATIGGFLITDHRLSSINNRIILNDDGSFHLGDTDGGIDYNSKTNQLGIDGSTVIIGSDDVNRTMGESVHYTETLYALSTSDTEFKMEVGSSWGKSMPERTSGTYIWQKTINHFMDGTDNSRTAVPVCIQGTKGEDATLLRIDSSRGNVFKNNEVETVLTVTIFNGSNKIEDIDTLHSVYGPSSYLQWSWLRIDDNTYGTILLTDKKISNDGFTLTLNPDDVDTKVTFRCELINE